MRIEKYECNHREYEIVKCDTNKVNEEQASLIICEECGCYGIRIDTFEDGGPIMIKTMMWFP